MLQEIVKRTKYEPREYQERIVGKVVDMFRGRYVDVAGETKPPYRSVMIESPTGSGKTCMMLLALKRLQEEIPDLHVCWVAMRRNLLHQAEAENRRMGVDVANIDFVSMFDSHPDFVDKAKGKPTIVVCDESQHDAASSMTHLHSLIEPDMILGATATPFRTDRVRLAFDGVVKDAGIHRLIHDGYLSPFNHFSIDNWNPETVANHYLAEPERWGKSVVFFHKWDDCLRFYDILKEREKETVDRLMVGRDDLPLGRGLVESVRGGGTKRDFDEREEIIDDFRHGDVAVLVNCMVLTEGFDAPSLETAFVRDSVKGPTMQMAGRAFRKHPRCHDEQFRYKNIVQSRHTKWPILRTAMANQQYLWQSSEWRSLKVNPHIESISNAARYAIAHADVNMPDFLKKK